MHRLLLILLISVSVWAGPVPQDRNEPNSMTDFAGKMVKSMAGSAAKNVAEGMIDQASNIFNLAQSAGKSLTEIWTGASKRMNGQFNKNTHDEDPNNYGYKYRRAEDPIVDEIMRKKIQSTMKDLDEVLAPTRVARDETGNMLLTLLGTIISMLKSIPQLEPIIKNLEPIFHAMGINV